jgi:hypothetical protein
LNESRFAIALRSGVIPAKAGIHACGFAQDDAIAASTPKATADWIPAFAGMTAEGIGADAGLASPRQLRPSHPDIITGAR